MKHLSHAKKHADFAKIDIYGIKIAKPNNPNAVNMIMCWVSLGCRMLQAVCKSESFVPNTCDFIVKPIIIFTPELARLGNLASEEERTIIP